VRFRDNREGLDPVHIAINSQKEAYFLGVPIAQLFPWCMFQQRREFIAPLYFKTQFKKSIGPLGRENPSVFIAPFVNIFIV
jgi:hypothetical protein